MRVYPIAKIAVIMDVIQRGLLKDTSHIIPMTTINEMHGESFKSESIKLRPVLECKKLHLFFTKEEEVRGQRALEDLGIPQGSPFVCFHSRDSAYLNILYPDRDWSYHDYRDSSIFNYLASVEELVRRGYYAIRMGAVVKEKLKTTNPAIIDYAINGKRTDFLDIYLGAKCRFFICSDTGLSIIPEVFRRPTVYTNWTDIKRISPWVLNGLFIIKKFYSNKEKRFFKFKELLGFQFGESETKNFFSENGIELVENNQEEIMDVVDEMETRLRGDWKAGEEDEELQRRFWAIFGPYKLKSPDLLIGAKFLRQNRQLLD